MVSKTLVVALLFSSVALASPTNIVRRDVCRQAYDACNAAKSPQIICDCKWTRCLGEDNARTHEYCAAEIAKLAKPEPSGIPGGCNPAHPGSCNPVPKPAGRPNETDELHASVAAKGPVLVSPPKVWSISNLIRYCAEGNTGCDYNFKVTVDSKTEHCTILRNPGSNAATERWHNQKCNIDSELEISWFYSLDSIPSSAIIAVAKGKEFAWFEVPNVNRDKPTPSSPFGSGHFGILPVAPVYTWG